MSKSPHSSVYLLLRVSGLFQYKNAVKQAEHMHHYNTDRCGKIDIIVLVEIAGLFWSFRCIWKQSNVREHGIGSTYSSSSGCCCC